MSAEASTNTPAPEPRSPSDRLRSRHNARIHGLTAALPDSEAEAALMQGFCDRWTAELGPEVEAEEALIRASAAAFARFERCRRAEDDALRDASRDALERWIRRKQHAARRKAQDLAKDPINTVSDLEASSFGIEWLQRHWTRLDAALAQGIGWDHRDQALAMTMLGFLPKSPGPDGDPLALEFYHLMLVGCGLSANPPGGLPADPAIARSALRSLIAEEFERLDALREERWEQQDGPEAEGIARAGLVDLSKDGQLRQRYRREAYSEMVRGLNQVLRVRVERLKDDDRKWRRAHPGGRRPDLGPPKAPSPASSRNEPPQAPPIPPEPRHNPNPEHTLRNTIAGASPTPDWRTEPRFEAPRPPAEPPPIGGSTPNSPPITPG
jgi:hypothetical protein